MKLKNIFEIEKVDDKEFMVCLDSSVFAGMIQLNETAAFIVECLKEETSIEEIAGKMAQIYEVDVEHVTGAVERIVAQLQSINALEN